MPSSNKETIARITSLIAEASDLLNQISSDAPVSDGGNIKETSAQRDIRVLFPQASDLNGKVVRMSELTKNGIPRSLLVLAYRTPGQRFAYKNNPGAKNSPIMFDVDGFTRWAAENREKDAFRREYHMRINER